MFAFGIWDRKRSLILARIELEKPLYFGWQGEGNNEYCLVLNLRIKGASGFNADLNKDAITLQRRHNCILLIIQFIKIFINYYPGIICKSMNMT